MSELGDKRIRFTECLAKLILFIVGQGKKVMIGQDGLKHMKGSLHFVGLAQDLLIFDKDGKYLTKDEDYAFAGEYWKSLDPDARWGGDFPGDGNHFSFTYQGKK